MVIKIYICGCVQCTFVMFNDEEASEFVFVLVLGRLLWQMSGRLLVRQYSALREQIAIISTNIISETFIYFRSGTLRRES